MTDEKLTIFFKHFGIYAIGNFDMRWADIKNLLTILASSKISSEDFEAQAKAIHKKYTDGY